MAEDSGEVRFVIRMRRDVAALQQQRGSLEEPSGSRFFFSNLRDLPALVGEALERQRAAAADEANDEA